MSSAMTGVVVVWVVGRPQGIWVVGRPRGIAPTGWTAGERVMRRCVGGRGGFGMSLG